MYKYKLIASDIARARNTRNKFISAFGMHVYAYICTSIIDDRDCMRKRMSA
jgi:hypothetical protein